MSYEFKDHHNSIIISVSSLGLALAGLISIGGIVGIIDSILDARVLQNPGQGSVFVVIIFVIQYTLQLFAGILFIPSMIKFRRIATKSGSDIKNLLTTFDNLGTLFKFALVMITISILLDLVFILIKGVF